MIFCLKFGKYVFVYFHNFKFILNNCYEIELQTEGQQNILNCFIS